MSKPTRPQSIVRFERVYLASVAAGLGGGIVKQSVIGIPASSLLPLALALATVMAAYWFFWFYIARRGSNLVRWLFCVFVVFNLVALPDIWANDLRGGVACAILSVSTAILQAAALLMLCGKGANLWLSHKGRIPESMTDVFG